MAIYHLSVKPVSRGAGRSATAAAAYRAAERIKDHTTGQVFDYTRKRGVEHAEIVLPVEAARRDINWARDRQQLWNAAEVAEKRKDARVAREYEVALPQELSKAQRLDLTREFSQELANRFGCAVDFAIHKPHREGDQRNFHAHILTTTRQVEATGLGAKTSIEWADTDRAKQGLGAAKEEVTAIRERWAVLTNEKLQALGHESRVDHRSLEAQGEQRIPSQHMGPAVTAIERRGDHSEVGWRVREEASERLRLAAELGRIERERQAIERLILNLSNDVAAARKDRDAGLTPQYDLEAERRAGRDAWLEWRANNQDQLEQERTTQVHRPNREAPDDDFSLD
jgi:ATP-dependent exoDNAse (exonuclease V) alpha subunit